MFCVLVLLTVRDAVVELGDSVRCYGGHAFQMGSLAISGTEIETIEGEASRDKKQQCPEASWKHQHRHLRTSILCALPDTVNEPKERISVPSTTAECGVLQ